MSRVPIHELLHQDKEWVTRDGRRLALEEMTPRHRANTLAMLRRSAAVLEWNDAVTRVLPMAGPDMGDQAQLAFDQVLDQRGEDPLGWLETTALVSRLADMVAADIQATIDHEHDPADFRGRRGDVLMPKHYRHFTIRFGPRRLHAEMQREFWGRDLRLAWGKRLVTLSWRPDATRQAR